MTRFDEAPSFDTDGWRWLRPIGRQPAAFIASVFAIALVAGIAAGFLFAAEAARVQAGRLVAATRFAVVLAPQVGRVDAEAMRSQFESIPLVAEARLETREQALTRLASAATLVGAARINPIPDVWVLTVRRPQTDAALRSFADDRARFQETLAAIPGVASVRVDAEWLGFVDRWTGIALRTLPAVRGVTLGVLGAIVFCIAFLSGRTARGGPEPRAGGGPAILTGALAAILGLAIAGALTAAVGNIAGNAAIEWAGLQQALQVGADSPLLPLSATVLAASVIGTWLGGLR